MIFVLGTCYFFYPFVSVAHYFSRTFNARTLTKKYVLNAKVLPDVVFNTEFIRDSIKVLNNYQGKRLKKI